MSKITEEFKSVSLDTTKLDCLASAVSDDITTQAIKQVNQQPEDEFQKRENIFYSNVNEILDDIRTNTMALAVVKVSSVNWTRKDALYGLGLIYKQGYKQEIQTM